MKPEPLVLTASVSAKEASNEDNTSQNSTNGSTKLEGDSKKADDVVKGVGDEKEHARPLILTVPGAVNVGAKEVANEPNIPQNTTNGGTKLKGDLEEEDGGGKGFGDAKLCPRPLCSLAGDAIYTIDNDAQLRPISWVEEDYRKPAALTTVVADRPTLHKDGSNVVCFGCHKHLGNSPQSIFHGEGKRKQCY